MKKVPVQHILDLKKQILDRLSLHERILPYRILWRYWSRDFITMPLWALMFAIVISSPIILIIHHDLPDFMIPITIFVTLVFVFRAGQISRRAMEIEFGIGSWRGSLKEVHFQNDIQSIEEVLVAYSLWNGNAVWGLIEILDSRTTTSLLKDMKDFWRYVYSLGVGLMVSWLMLDVDATNRLARYTLQNIMINLIYIFVMVEALFAATPLLFKSAWTYRQERLLYLLRRIHLSMSSDVK